MQDFTNLETLETLINDINQTRGKEKSFKYAIIENFFKQKLLDPSTVLTLATEICVRESDFPIVLLCMDYISNKDFYIADENRGNMHILIYGALNIKDEDVLILFCYMLILKGCDPLSPAFKNNSLVKSENIYRWFQANKNILLPQTQTEALSSIDTLPEISKIILNVAFDLLPQYSIEMIDVIIVCRVNVLNKIDIYSLNKLLIKTFHAVLKEMFIDLLNYGLIPSYLDICYFVSHFIRAKNMKNSENLCEDLRIMLNEIVKRGIEIDEYIITEISNVDPLCGIVLKESYERPLWQKISYNKSDNYVPKQLKELAMFFGFENEEEKLNLCTFFNQLATADEETVIKNYAEKNMILQSARLTPGINKITSNIKIQNSDSFRSKVFEYPDIMTYFYREKGLNYGFLSSNFDILLRNKINPVTGNALKEHSLNELKNKISFLEQNGIELSSVKSIKEIIQKFKSSEILNRQKRLSIIDEISRKIYKLGFDKDQIMSAEINFLENRFQISIRYYFSYDQNLTKLDQLNLSAEFIFLVFCVILYENEF